jgi:hypothetical protein
LGHLIDDLDERVQPLINPSRLASYHLFKAGLTPQIAPSSAGNTASIKVFERDVSSQVQHH